MVVGLALVGTWAAADPWEDTPSVRAMKDEIARSIDQLQVTGSAKPYLVSYLLSDRTTTTVNASFGALVESETDPMRTLDLDVHVGDYKLDNSNIASDNFGDERGRTISLPIEDDYDAVRRDLWLATDRQYKHAVEQLERKQTLAKTHVTTGTEADSFSKETPSHITDDHPVPAVDATKLEALAKKVSAVFRDNPDAYTGDVTIRAVTAKQYFVSSEGSASMQSGSFVRVTLECTTQADDGMTLRDTRSWFADTVDALPSESELVTAATTLSAELSALRAAPVTDDYRGPILFTDVAAGQVIRAVLAEDLAGTPAAKGSEMPSGFGGTESNLVGKVGQRILPVGTKIVADPTVQKIGTVTLAGATAFDEEGVRAQKVTLVDNGTLKQFLMSRIPRKGFEHSNGHASSSWGMPTRAHPSNLFVTAKKAVSAKALRKQALALAKAEDLDYVLVIERLDPAARYDDLDAVMTPEGRTALGRPMVMRRVYRDGHDELVRGGTVGSVAIRNLRDIVGFGNAPTAYSYSESGYRGFGGIGGDWEFGYLASIVTPSLLLRDLDVSKPVGPQRAPAVVPRPTPPSAQDK
jgi:hypothetical protein